MRKKTVINGKNMSYYEVGDGQPILFLHGWGRSHADFIPIIECLKANFRCIAVDLPGFGQSDEPNQEKLDIDGYTDAIDQLIEQLNIESAHVICHSFGGRITLKLAAAQKVKGKLVFTGGAGIEPPRSFSFKMKVMHYKFMKILVKTPFYKQYQDDLLANSGSADYKNASPIMKRVLSLTVSEDLSHLLPLVANQTLLYWGQLDDATPLSYGEQMEREMPSATLISMPGLTHYAFLEASDDFKQKVSAFLEVK